MSKWSRKGCKVETRDPGTNELWVACADCNHKTAHRILSEIQETWSDDHVWGTSQFRIIQCAGCKRISFCEDSQFSEEFDYAEDGSPVYPDNTRLYPNRVEGRSLLPDYEWLPEGIDKIYVETHRALTEKSFVLAGIGMRAIIETICKERKAKGKKLDKMIDDLIAQGVVTAEGGEILHSIRYLGNKAAHEVKAHTNRELEIAMNVVEHTLKSVYLIPKEAEAIKRKQTPPPKNSPSQGN